MADKDWRPENWEQIIEDLAWSFKAGANYIDRKFEAGDFLNGVEAGASAMHLADVEYLEGKCTEHPFRYGGNPITEFSYYEHRYLCPICYAAWKGEKI